MSFVIKKNKSNEFFLIKSFLSLSPDWDDSEFFDIDNISSDYKTKIDYAICVWPLSDGYARFLGKNGNWGFLHEYTLEPFFLDSDVLYADDFSCGLAKIQFADETFNYLNSRLKLLCEHNFEKASTFVGGYAIVSDSICRNYKIDINGNIAEIDKSRYKIALDMFKSNNDEEINVINRKSFDPESRIMNALSGNGPDPEDYGF